MKAARFKSNYTFCRFVNKKRSEKILIANRAVDSRCVAVKIEKSTRKYGRRKKVCTEPENNLEHEHYVYKQLHGRGTPSVHWFGTVDGCKTLVMDLMGPALEELFVFCNRRFSLKTVLMLADQMLEKIQCMHDAGYIHGNITPDNFVMGIEKNCAKVYLINMKWASKYTQISNGCQKHIQYKENVVFYGSPCFVSVNRHLRTVTSRRDDLESFLYVILYFLKGSLPWQVYENSSNQLERILELKASISSEDLCHGLPVQFVMILNYCRALAFEAEPDYLFIRRLLKNLFQSSAFEEDWKYDWISLYSCTKQ